MQKDAPFYLVIFFIVLSYGLAVFIVWGYRMVLKKTEADDKIRRRKIMKLALPLLLWFIFLEKISAMNYFHDWSAMPPRLMIAFLPPLLFAIVLVASKRVMAFIKQVPQHWLILIQSFRIAMEVILLMLFLENIIPVQMTFEGRNFDILAGITALPVGYLAYRKKLPNSFIIAWNIFGLILLANIVVIAVLSTPLPFRVFMNDPANTIIAYFPFIWLPGFVVPVAYTMHFLSIKKCLAENKATAKLSV